MGEDKFNGLNLEQIDLSKKNVEREKEELKVNVEKEKEIIDGPENNVETEASLEKEGKKDIEEILKSSPELLEVLKEEKEFEDLMNTHTVQELTRSPEDEVVDLDEAEDINTTKQND